MKETPIVVINSVDDGPLATIALDDSAGIRLAMANRGLETPDAWMTRLGYARTEGRAAAVQLLESGPLPTALVVANFNAALGALAEIYSRNLRVPADISIVSIHDVW